MDAKQKHDAKQLRRKQNRELRKQGLEVLVGNAASMIACRLTTGPQIGALKKRAEQDMRVRCVLSDRARNGADAAERAAAAKARRKLNNQWFDRGSSSIRGYWDASQKAGPCTQLTGV